MQPVDQAVEFAVLAHNSRGEHVVALLRQHRDMSDGVLCNGQFSGEAYERIHPLGFDPEQARGGIGPDCVRRNRIRRRRLVQALDRRFDSAGDAGRVQAGQAFCEGVDYALRGAGASEIAKYISRYAPGRRDPTLESLPADGEQRDLLPQNCDCHGRGGRLRSDSRRCNFQRLDRGLAGREADRELIRRSVGVAGDLTVLLDRIEPLNHLVHASEAIADESRGDRTLAPANHR